MPFRTEDKSGGGSTHLVFGGREINSARRRMWGLSFFVQLYFGERFLMKKLRAVSWLSALYFVEGLPNAIVASLSVGYYKSMGLDNSTIAMLTSALYLPWVLKGFWGPLVDSFSTKRRWILACGSIFFLSLVGLSLAQFFESWVLITSAIFWLFAMVSATYDISADGFYMLALSEREQSFFVGIRNAFYRFAVLFGQGAMMILAGVAKDFFGTIEMGWAVSFGVCALIVGISLPLLKQLLPIVSTDSPKEVSNAKDIASNIIVAFKEFFAKKKIGIILLFVLFYRFAEAQLVRIVQPFLLDRIADGGLAMTPAQMGMVYGTFAPIALLGGGILGGMFISRRGLAKSLLIMACAINLPNIIYVYMAAVQPQNLILNAFLISIEQFGYGFGFAGYMVFLMWASEGENKTSSYAICTSLMALGMVFPGFFSGQIQMSIGYYWFFWWIMFATSLSFAVSLLALSLLKKSDKY